MVIGEYGITEGYLYSLRFFYHHHHHHYIRFKILGPVKASLKSFLQAVLFLATIYQLIIFSFLISSSYTIHPPRSGPSNIRFPHWSTFHSSLSPLITLHFKMVYPSHSSYFNMCDNIRDSIKMLYRTRDSPICWLGPCIFLIFFFSKIESWLIKFYVQPLVSFPYIIAAIIVLYTFRCVC